jgi:hypothetical protein
MTARTRRRQDQEKVEKERIKEAKSHVYVISRKRR